MTFHGDQRPIEKIKKRIFDVVFGPKKPCNPDMVAWVFPYHEADRNPASR
jgi:hypothetical protein